MAIDNREKRQSAATAGAPFNPPAVTSNSGKDQEWRQQVCWGYSGILVGGIGADIRRHIIQAYMRINK